METLYFLEHNGRLYGTYGERRVILGTRDIRTMARVRTRLTTSRANLDRMPRVRVGYSSKLGAQVTELQYEPRVGFKPKPIKLREATVEMDRSMNMVRDLFTMGRSDILLVEDFRYDTERDVLTIRGPRLSHKDYVRHTDVDTDAQRSHFERALRAK